MHHPLFRPWQPQVGSKEQRVEGTAAAAQEAPRRHAVPGLLWLGPQPRPFLHRGRDGGRGRRHGASRYLNLYSYLRLSLDITVQLGHSKPSTLSTITPKTLQSLAWWRDAWMIGWLAGVRVCPCTCIYLYMTRLKEDGHFLITLLVTEFLGLKWMSMVFSLCWNRLNRCGCSRGWSLLTISYSWWTRLIGTAQIWLHDQILGEDTLVTEEQASWLRPGDYQSRDKVTSQVSVIGLNDWIWIFVSLWTVQVLSPSPC